MFERMLCEPPRLYIVGLSESLGGHSALSTMMDRIDLAVSFRKVKPPTSVVDIIGRMRLSASETQDAKVHRWRVGYTLAWRCRRIQLCIWHGGSSNIQDCHVCADFRPRNITYIRAHT